MNDKFLFQQQKTVVNLKRRLLLKKTIIAITLPVAITYSTLAKAVSATSKVSARVKKFILTPKKSKANLIGNAKFLTDVWGYNGIVPGPTLRLKQGDILQATLINALEEPTTIHWHGLRLPNNMDGVPVLTQKAVDPNKKFEYSFQVKDSGTYWYHPHVNTPEQLGRGLYGALIVEEKKPPKVDRELLWILDDWRINNERQITPNFGSRGDISHGGRMGNVPTINGKAPENISVQKGERIRLRLINVSNARIFSLNLTGMKSTIIAIDGQPVTPHPPEENTIYLGSGMRFDLILDFNDKPDSKHPLLESSNPNNTIELLEFIYRDKALRDKAPNWEMALEPNVIPEPDLENASHNKIVIAGGMMGMRYINRSRREKLKPLFQAGKVWFLNDKVFDPENIEPLFKLKLGKSYRFVVENQTLFPHPMHLHGYVFRVLSRNGKATKYKQWQDTVLLDAQGSVEIAFVADNLGRWLFHCHILEHTAGGMIGVLEVR